MTSRLTRIIALMMLLPVVSGCAAAAVGAAGAIVADEVAEDNGNDLF
ncbi:hypothetical protein P775_06985 [Puniceibacterium antarcticum]|uniref:Lipoprotein n=1 Tax=Puniceibacterium antarcticum TaxID=1206336 RepID=A0A2G8RHA5_9RHOB|nr:hypothetical protein [Puniceibacterium antarcticum]PIL20902.1 hypothetical protein P775_06985 [Puniceibacterium antarcticum]